MTTAALIERECDGLKAFLLAKNAAYGDSARRPVRIFSRADPLEQLRVRIDDKLSRVQRGHEFPGDDTYRDLAGYCVLFLALQAEARPQAIPEVPDRSCLLSGGGVK